MKYIPSIDKKFEPLILKYRAFEKEVEAYLEVCKNANKQPAFI